MSTIPNCKFCKRKMSLSLYKTFIFNCNKCQFNYTNDNEYLFYITPNYTEQEEYFYAVVKDNKTIIMRGRRSFTLPGHIQNAPRKSASFSSSYIDEILSFNYPIKISKTLNEFRNKFKLLLMMS